MNPIYSTLLNIMKLGSSFFPLLKTIYNNTIGYQQKTPITQDNYKQALSEIGVENLDLSSSFSQRNAMNKIQGIQDETQRTQLQNLLEQLNTFNVQSKSPSLYTGNYNTVQQQ